MNGLSRAKTQRAQSAGYSALVILWLLCVTAFAAEDRTEQAKRACDRAIAVLLKKQAADGGWHSETYALLKPGVALTALALDTLSRLPQAEREKIKPQLDNALAFLRKNQNEAGALGATAEWVEYPVYATALAVTAVVRLKPDGWAEQIKPWVKWLKSQQYTERDGAQKGDGAYGGWSPVGIVPAGLDKRADISTTRYVLQALQAAEVRYEDFVWPRALKFVQNCQNLRIVPEYQGDGGFCYAPANPNLNKAGADEKSVTGIKSYDTATMDGLLCLEILKRGHELHPDRARSWLRQHVASKRGALPESDHAGLWYYYHAGAMQMPEVSGHPAKQYRTAVRLHAAKALLKEQGADGLWHNPTDTMKENDPLLATLYALQALITYTENAP